jgi:DNA-binding CsgD family transcriptional regulator
MARIEDFFISSNAISDIPEEEYQKIGVLKDMVNAVSRIAYQSLYIIDYNKKNFLYVSSNPLFLCGRTSEEVKNSGYLFYINHVPEREQAMLIEINREGFNFYEKIPVGERLNYAISYDFHLISGRKKTLVNHKLTPMLLTNDGKIWLAVCIVSLSSHSSPGHIIIRKIGQTTFWEYSLEKHCWEGDKKIILIEKERDILVLSAQGYTMNEIADKLCIALDTVKSHKRKIFGKLRVKNISEALFFATNYNLL